MRSAPPLHHGHTTRGYDVGRWIDSQEHSGVRETTVNKAKLNYWIDLLIAIAFLMSAVSGLMFLLPGNWASAGADGLPRLLGLTLLTWSDLHTYSSLAMMAGVAAHLALHARWIRQMTASTFGAQRKGSLRAVRRVETAEAVPATTRRVVTRRRFLRTACWGVVAMACTGAAYAAIRGVAGQSAKEEAAEAAAHPDPTETILVHTATQAAATAETTLPGGAASPTASPTSRVTTATTTPSAPTVSATVTPTEEPESVTVRCPRGLVYDPYPGRCRMYVDRNGDGYCDYSEPLES